MTEEAVLPVLEAILDTDGNVLRYFHLPKQWREEPSEH